MEAQARVGYIKRGTKTVEIAERHVASTRSALLRIMQSTAEEIRVAKNVFHAWVLKTKIGAIWAQRLDEKSSSAAEPHQATSFPCPRCGLTLHLKGEATQAIIYDIIDWERQCQHTHLDSPQLCQLLSLGPSGIVH